MNYNIVKIETRLRLKPLGYLADIAIKLSGSSHIKIKKLEEMNDLFGFYSPEAQRSIIMGYIKRRLNNKNKTSFACDRVLEN